MPINLDVLVAMSDDEQAEYIEMLSEADLRELLVAVLDAYGRTAPAQGA